MLISRHDGFSVIELMIGIAILTILLAVGIPSFTLWVQNMQMRSTAESALTGLHTARAEALKRNARVRFSLTNATGLAAWSVGCVNVTTIPDCPAIIQTHASAEGSGNARLGIATITAPSPAPAGQFATQLAAGSGLPAGVTFDGFGRVPDANIGTDITRIDVTNSSTTTTRRMVITISSGGMLRMCDPALARSTAAQGC